MDSLSIAIIKAFLEKNVISIASGLCAITLLRWYFDKDRRDIAKIPGPKPKWLIGSLIGNLDLVWKKNLPISETYILIHRELAYEYRHLGMYKFSIGFSRGGTFVMVSKANTVEAILSSSVNISKSHSYSFLSPWLGEGKKWLVFYKRTFQSIHKHP